MTTSSSTATPPISFGDGASAPEELAQAAAELGHEALALTDHDGVWGAMEFAQACKSFGVRPIVGAEITVTPTADTLRRQPRLRLRCRRVRAPTGRRVKSAPTGTSSLAPTGYSTSSGSTSHCWSRAGRGGGTSAG